MSVAKVKDPAPGYLDEVGCVNSSNEIAQLFNKELRKETVKLRTELSDAGIVYVDMYAAKYELISQARNQGPHHLLLLLHHKLSILLIIR